MKIESEAELCAVAEERIFGRSLLADTPAKIGSAVMSGLWSSLPRGDVTEFRFEWNNREYRIDSRASRWGYRGAQGNDGYGLWYWEHRHGQPWQADIEAHVAAWRDKPRNFLTWEGMGLVVEAMEREGLRWHCNPFDTGVMVEFYRPGESRPAGASYVTTRDLRPVATFLAALRAKGIDVDYQPTPDSREETD